MRQMVKGFVFMALLTLAPNPLQAQPCYLCMEGPPQHCWTGEVDWGFEECDDTWGTCYMLGACQGCEFCDDLQADGTVATGLAEVLIDRGIPWDPVENGSVLRRPCDGAIVAREFKAEEVASLRKEHALIEL